MHDDVMQQCSSPVNSIKGDAEEEDTTDDIRLFLNGWWCRRRSMAPIGVWMNSSMCKRGAMSCSVVAIHSNWVFVDFFFFPNLKRHFSLDAYSSKEYCRCCCYFPSCLVSRVVHVVNRALLLFFLAYSRYLFIKTHADAWMEIEVFVMSPFRNMRT